MFPEPLFSGFSSERTVLRPGVSPPAHGNHIPARSAHWGPGDHWGKKLRLGNREGAVDTGIMTMTRVKGSTVLIRSPLRSTCVRQLVSSVEDVHTRVSIL